jgi:hypothetical protein
MSIRKIKHRKICSLLTRPLGLLGWETLEPVLLARGRMVDHPVDRPRPGTRRTRLERRLAGRLLLPIHGSLGAEVRRDALLTAGISKPSRFTSLLSADGGKARRFTYNGSK